MLNVDLLVLSLCLGLGTGFSAAEKTQYQIQNGPCSYTFLLPEQDNCQTQYNNYNYPVQKDGPTDNESIQRLEQLEISMENNTQWLLKVKLCHTHDISERNLNSVVKLYHSKLKVMTESLRRYQKKPLKKLQWCERGQNVLKSWRSHHRGVKVEILSCRSFVPTWAKTSKLFSHHIASTLMCKYQIYFYGWNRRLCETCTFHVVNGSLCLTTSSLIWESFDQIKTRTVFSLSLCSYIEAVKRNHSINNHIFNKKEKTKQNLFL